MRPKTHLVGGKRVGYFQRPARDLNLILPGQPLQMVEREGFEIGKFLNLDPLIALGHFASPPTQNMGLWYFLLRCKQTD